MPDLSPTLKSSYRAFDSTLISRGLCSVMLLKCGLAASLLYNLPTSQRVIGTLLNSAFVPSGHGVEMLRYRCTRTGLADLHAGM